MRKLRLWEAKWLGPWFMQSVIGGSRIRTHVSVTLETTPFTIKWCWSNDGEGCLLKEECTNLEQVEPWWRMYSRPGHSGPLAPTSCLSPAAWGAYGGQEGMLVWDLYSLYITLWRQSGLQSHSSSSVEELLLLQALIRPPTSNKPVAKDRGCGGLWLASLSHILPVGVKDEVTEWRGLRAGGRCDPSQDNGVLYPEKGERNADQTKPKNAHHTCQDSLPPVFSGFWRLWGRWIFEER